jgi:hypothetical protein
MVRDENAKLWMRNRTLQTGLPRPLASVMKAKQRPAGTPKRLGKATPERQKPTVTAELFPELVHGPHTERFA